MRDRLEAADGTAELMTFTGPLNGHRQRARSNPDGIRRHGQHRLAGGVAQHPWHIGPVGQHLPRRPAEGHRADSAGDVERLMGRHVNTVSGRIDGDQQFTVGAARANTINISALGAPATIGTTPERRVPSHSGSSGPLVTQPLSLTATANAAAAPAVIRCTNSFAPHSNATSSAVTVGTSGAGANAFAASSMAAYSRRGRAPAPPEGLIDRQDPAGRIRRAPTTLGSAARRDACGRAMRRLVHLGLKCRRQHLAQFAFVLLGHGRGAPGVTAAARVPSPRCDGSPSTLSAMVLR